MLTAHTLTAIAVLEEIFTGQCAVYMPRLMGSTQTVDTYKQRAAIVGLQSGAALHHWSGAEESCTLLNI